MLQRFKPFFFFFTNEIGFVVESYKFIFLECVLSNSLELFFPIAYNTDLEYQIVEWPFYLFCFCCRSCFVYKEGIQVRK